MLTKILNLNVKLINRNMWKKTLYSYIREHIIDGDGV